MNIKHTPVRLAALLVASLALVVAGFGDAQAQSANGTGGSLGQSGTRSGTAGAPELLVSPTARYAALGASGTSGVTGMNGIEALFANPAGLALGSGTNALFSRMNYVADIGVNYFGVSQQMGNNNVAFTVSSWDFGEIPEQTEIVPDVSDVTFQVNYLTAAFSFARNLTDRISVGTTVKMITESIDDVTGSGMALDAGMNYTVGESGLRFGVALKNIGSGMSYSGAGLTRLVKLTDQSPSAKSNALNFEAAAVELPTLLNFGMAYTRPIGAGSAVTFIGNFRSNSFDPDQYAGAVEFSYQDLFFVRGGYSAVESGNTSFYTGLSYGAGINLNLGNSALTVDYAYVPTDYFSNVQYITLSMKL
jgi:hypothetical protein